MERDSYGLICLDLNGLAKDLTLKNLKDVTFSYLSFETPTDFDPFLYAITYLLGTFSLDPPYNDVFNFFKFSKLRSFYETSSSKPSKESFY